MMKLLRSYSSRLTGVVALMGLILFATSCSFGPGLVTRLGEPLVEGGHSAFWSSDSSTLAWRDPGIQWIDLDSRQQGGFEHEGQLDTVRFSQDGNAIFYTTTLDDRLNVQRYSLLTESIDLLASSVEPSCCWDGHSLAVSSNGRHIAYLKSEVDVWNTYLYDLVSLEERFLTQGLPITFSPNGDELLVWFEYNGDPRVLRAVNVTDGSTSLEWQLSNRPIAFWTPVGIQLRIGGDTIQTLETGITHNWQDVSHLSLSPDGEAVAFYEDTCLEWQWVGNPEDWIPIPRDLVCVRRHYKLYFETIATGRKSLIAQGQGSAGGIAISPDGSMVAYRFNQEGRPWTIYLDTLP